jgi:hypothetical protein
MACGRLHVYRSCQALLCLHSLGTLPDPLVMFLESDPQPQSQPLEVKGVRKIWQTCSSALITMLKLENAMDRRRKRRGLEKAHEKACSEELAKQR